MQVFIFIKRILITILILCVHCGCGTDGDDGVETPNPLVHSGESGTGVVTGTVTDRNTDKPISGALVEFMGIEVRTDANGVFNFVNIPLTDSQELTIHANHYEPYTQAVSLNTDELKIAVKLNPLIGTVSGTVRDGITKQPIPGSIVSLLGLEVETEVDGGFTFFDIPYIETHQITVQDPDYHTFTQDFILDKQRLTLQIGLTPLNDHVEELNSFLENLSDLIESVDFENIPKLEALFSETYVASDDPVTTFGVVSGVVPPNYEGVVPTFNNIFNEYSEVHFVFRDREMDITHARKASIELFLEVDSVKVVDNNPRHLDTTCVFEFRREDSDWKIVYWEMLELNVGL